MLESAEITVITFANAEYAVVTLPATFYSATVTLVYKMSFAFAKSAEVEVFAVTDYCAVAHAS